MAITTLNGIIAGAKQNRPFYKGSIASKAAGSYASLWTAIGLPGAGSAPGTAAGAVCTQSTVGALAFTAPGGANLAYLMGLEWANSNLGVTTLYDRLVHTATLSGTSVAAQTVGSAALTRYTTGEDVECFIEIYTATGATAATATVSYTNEAGTAGRSGSASIVVSALAGQMFPVTLQAGDKGVRSVQSVTLSISTGTAGNFGITLARRLASMPVTLTNSGYVVDFGTTGFPEILPTACLSFICLAGGTVTGNSTGLVKTVEG